MKTIKKIGHVLFLMTVAALITLVVKHHFFSGTLFFVSPSVEIPLYFVLSLFILSRCIFLFMSDRKYWWLWILSIVSVLLYWWEFIQVIILEEK